MTVADSQIKLGSDYQGGARFVDALNMLRREGVATLRDFPYSEGDCSRQPDYQWVYPLQVSVDVFLDSFLVAASPPMSFSVRW